MKEVNDPNAISENLHVYISQSLIVIMHNSGTIILKTGVRYQVNGQMVVVDM